MIKIITIILLITSFFYPLQTSWVFVAFFVLLEGYLFFASRKREYSLNNITFNEEEKKIMEKYYLYFKYPFTARPLSSSLSLIALSAILLVPWLLYNYLWLQAAIIGLNYFIAQPLSARLNIRFYLHDAVERSKKEEHRKEMMIVDSICEKISNFV